MQVIDRFVNDKLIANRPEWGTDDIHINPRRRHDTLTTFILNTSDIHVPVEWIGVYDREVKKPLKHYANIATLVSYETALKPYDFAAEGLYLRANNITGKPQLTHHAWNSKLIGAVYIKFSDASEDINSDNFNEVVKHAHSMLKLEIDEFNEWLSIVSA